MRAIFDNNESKISYSKVNVHEQDLDIGIDQDNATANATTLDFDEEPINKKGNTRIYLNCTDCDFTSWINNYVMLPHKTNLQGYNIQTENAFGKVTEYESYSKFYKVTNNGTDEIGKFITILPVLESNLSSNELVFMYDSIEEYRNDYFSLNLNIQKYYPYCSIDRFNEYSLRIKSETANKQGYTKYPIKLFLDDQAPELWNYSIVEVSVSGESPETINRMNFTIKEHKCGSGLDLNNSKIIITPLLGGGLINPINSSLAYLNYTTDVDSSDWIIYEFNYDITNTNVNITFDVNDYAGNEMINSSIKKVPIIKFKYPYNL